MKQYFNAVLWQELTNGLDSPPERWTAPGLPPHLLDSLLFWFWLSVGPPSQSLDPMSAVVLSPIQVHSPVSVHNGAASS